MFKTTTPGFLLLASSLLLFMLKLISRLMEKEMNFFSLKELFGLDWINHIPISAARQAMVAISSQQFSVLFLVIGCSFILLGAFKKN